jgi:alpha-amylase
LDIPRLGEQRPIIMFQAFDWSSCKADSWYTILLGLLPELRTAGVNMMWLPPPSDSVDEHGYLPRKWYNLDNHYGTAGALHRLVHALHAQEIVPMLDVVVNHRCASLQDSAGRWLKFEEPDWEGWAICCDSPAIPGGTGSRCTGEPAQYAPSIDHQNPKVRNDINSYIRYMMEEVGFRALRFDFVKGYSPHFQRDYVRAAGSPFAVAENWNGDPNGLHQYVRECQGAMAVYDFPVYYTLKRAVHSNNFEDLNEGGRPCGIMGRDPARSVTFIDNHDTYQLAIVGGAFGNNDQVLRAYAYILTHPGTPCVFHYDYVRAPYVREKLLQLCAIRRDAGIHSTSRISICASGWGLYAAIIGDKVAMKMGTNDWGPGHGWKFAFGGSEFAVWIRG